MRYPIILTTFIAFFSVSSPAIGQAKSSDDRNFPTRVVRLVVAFPPGGGTDLLARVIAPKLADRWGQQVVVDNRAGASGIVGSDMVAKSAPDGYTILLATSGTHGISQSLYRQLPYDTIKDFTPITRVTISPNILAVNPSVSARNIGELIALAKAKPGQLNYSSSGLGSNPHLAGELFKSMAGINVVHVPYKGVGPAIVDLIGGQTQFMIAGAAALLPYTKDNRLRGLATTSEKPLEGLPVLAGFPTIASAGLPGYEADTWFGVFGPAGMQRAVVSRLNESINFVLRMQEIRDLLSAQGMAVAGSTPEELGGILKAEIEKWAKVIKDNKVPLN